MAGQFGVGKTLHTLQRVEPLEDNDRTGSRNVKSWPYKLFRHRILFALMVRQYIAALAPDL
jgi:hypothetical protein